jgi:radical SAM protein with 4Fe4S-binding SPASM domain
MSCPHIPDLRYSAFGQRLKEHVGERRIPLSASLELTFRCNLRCQHCYVQCDQASWADEPELTTDQWRGILDQLANAGVLWLLLTGGEPLLRPDFAEIYMHAKRRGMLVTLFTNATLVDDDIADLLAAYPPFAVEVSLYGRTAEVYERVTTVPGSFERCMAGISRLAARPILLRLKTPLMTLNRDELWDIRAYAESLDLPFRFDALLNAGLAGGAEPAALRLSPEEVVAHQLADGQSRDNWCQVYERQTSVVFDRSRLYVCGAGVRAAHVDPSGRLSVCMMAREPSYDLLRGSFREAWDEFIPSVRSAAMRPDAPCRDCDLRAVCDNCPAYAMMETGDPCGAVPYYCAVAKVRTEAMERLTTPAD